MKVVFFAGAIFAASTVAGIADPIPNGDYSGHGDGTNISMRIAGLNARIITTAPGCSGAGEGEIMEIAEGRYQIKLTQHGQCTVDVTETEQGYLLEPQYNAKCGAYSGQACGLYGNVTPE